MSDIRIKRLTDNDCEAYLFHCPGCKEHHAYYVKHPAGKRMEWEFNGDMEKPTFHPSLLNKRPDLVCHLFLRNGKIEFCGDCTHDLKGQTVELPPFEIE